MRMHVVGFPHTEVTREYSWCAYTQKVRRFADMMARSGHEVFLYGGGSYDVDERVTCVPVNPREAEPPDRQLNPPSWDGQHPFWAGFNEAASRAIRERVSGGGPMPDPLCVIAGNAQRSISDELPDLPVLEYGIGYAGTFSPYRVFESYAWMHALYGQGGAYEADGRFYDEVIPNSFEPGEFRLGPARRDYLLYIGRLISRKGVGVAVEAAARAGMRLVAAGSGDRDLLPGWVDYRGTVGPEERAELMAGAAGVLVPTQYVEPFGGAAVEAMLSGAPAITTDWGAFTETVEQDRTGWRCRTLEEFAWACRRSAGLGSRDRRAIRERALRRFSVEAARARYDDWIARVADLWGDGWYDSKPRRPYPGR